MWNELKGASGDMLLKNNTNLDQLSMMIFWNEFTERMNLKERLVIGY
jgi:hypothetical protein